MNLTVTLSLGFFLLISSTAAWAGINPDAGRRDGYRACWSVIGGSDPDCPFRTAEAACEFHAEVNRQKPFDYVQKVSSTGGFCHYIGTTSSDPVNLYCAGNCDGPHMADDDLPPDCGDSLEVAGNPILVANGAKYQAAADWVSPIDSRFKVSRFHRSDDLMNDFTHGHSKIKPPASHGEAWSNSFDRRVELPYGHEDVMVFREDGRRFLFEAPAGVFSKYEPYRSGHPYRLFKSGNAPTRTFALELGDGVVEVYEEYSYYDNALSTTQYSKFNGPRFGLLKEIRWPDGYQISITRDPATLLTERVTDSFSQQMRFTWTARVNDAPENTPRVESVRIDTQFIEDFDPDIRINYTYVLEYLHRNLSNVEIRSVSEGTGGLLWAYEYLDESATQPKLTKIYNGATNTSGTLQSIRTFSYDSNQFATSSSHFGGQHKVTVKAESQDPNQYTVTNAKGLTTTVDMETVAGRRRAVRTRGEATLSCLGTNTTYDYTKPSEESPEGYVYGKVERIGTEESAPFRKRKTTYTRDSRGLPLSMIEDDGGPDERVTFYTWHADFRLIKTRETEHLHERYVYDSDGLVTRYTQTDVKADSPSFGEKRVWKYTYETQGSGYKRLVSKDGPGLSSNGVNDTWSYTYDDDNRLKSVTDPEGLVVRILSRDDYGNPMRIRGANQVEWHFEHDARGRMTKITREKGTPSEQVTAFTYTPFNDVATVTDASGAQWEYVYNSAQRLKRINDPVGHSAIFTHDEFGNVLSTRFTDASGGETFSSEAEFDELGRLLRTIGGAAPSAQVTEYTHDRSNNVAKTTDPEGYTRSAVFDALNRLSSETDEKGWTREYSFNRDDEQTMLMAQNNTDYISEYNGFGEVVRELSPTSVSSSASGVTEYEYDTRGLLTRKVDGRGIETIYEYDDAGRMKATRHPSSSQDDVEYTYYGPNAGDTTSIGQLNRINEKGFSTRWSWHESGRPAWHSLTIDGESYKVNYDYDERDLLTRVTYPSGRQVRWSLAPNGDVTRVQTRPSDSGSWETLAGDIKTLPFGSITAIEHPDGLTETRDFDASYRLTQLRDKKSSSTLRNQTFKYTARDELREVNDTVDGATSETLSYDSTGQLYSAAGPYGTMDYRYRRLGDRDRVREGGGPWEEYEYGAGTELVTTRMNGSPHRSYLYDGAGHVVEEVRPRGSGTNTDLYEYEYNDAGRMARVRKNGTRVGDYLYNSMGQLVWRRLQQTGETFHYVYDNAGNRIAEYEYKGNQGVSELLREFVWLEGRPLAVITPESTVTVRSDHIGRPVFATGANGNVKWRVVYRPFGEVHSVTGGQDAMTLGFPGQWYHEESGLYQNWHRDYDAATGRYLQSDPLRLVDGPQVHSYALGNPMRYTDFMGLSTGGGESSSNGDDDDCYYCEQLRIGLMELLDRIRENIELGHSIEGPLEDYIEDQEKYDLKCVPLGFPATPHIPVPRPIPPSKPEKKNERRWLPPAAPRPLLRGPLIPLFLPPNWNCRGPSCETT
ncbi:MAG: RHS repeat-associated core domain-containing protein [Myxococcota bacterium]